MPVTCPRCGAALPDWMADLMDFPNAHENYVEGGCRYEACDDPACRALKEPGTEAELRAALAHWRTHRVDGGCAHGN